MHLEEMKKEIEALALEKGFYNKPEDIPKKLLCMHAKWTLLCGLSEEENLNNYSQPSFLGTAYGFSFENFLY